MEEYMTTLIIGLIVGILARVYLLRVDFRLYPSYPHGYVTHLSLGFIAAALGAVAIPAILEKEFTAVSFLALAATQFRDVRNIERETLGKLEEGELVKRGNDYIEGIAKTFEARNYLVMSVAFFTALIFQITKVWYLTIIFGIGFILIASLLMRGKEIGDICEVKPADVSFKGTLLKVDDIDFMLVGLKDIRAKILSDALGVVIKPKDDDARATIHNLGQRQAIAHTAASIVGCKIEVDVPDFTPLVRKDVDTGKMALYIVPNEKDIKALVEAVNRTPVLETSKRSPLRSKAGKYASD